MNGSGPRKAYNPWGTRWRPMVFQALRQLNYDGWLTIEGFGFALKDLSAAAAIWRDIERTPESIAFEGFKFLKKSVAAG